MFLRRKSKTVRGVGCSYWHFCRTVRTARGPRQQVVASLGTLSGEEHAGLSGGWEDLTKLLRGEPPAPQPRTASLPGLDTGELVAPQWEQAGLRRLRVERSRDFGDSYLALSLWHRLGLDGRVGPHRGRAHRRALLRPAFGVGRGRALVRVHGLGRSARRGPRPDQRRPARRP